MNFRPFKCRACGHRMRFETEVCGKCYCTKYAFQHQRFYVAITAVAALSTAAIVNA